MLPQARGITRRIIEAMEPTEYELARRWIPVTERLPQPFNDYGISPGVLVAFSDGSIALANCMKQGGVIEWNCTSDNDGEPTHWMPPPAPPTLLERPSEAADEIERLRQLREEDGKAMSALIDGYERMKSLCANGKYLEDAEREALIVASTALAGLRLGPVDVPAALRGLLNRLG